MLRGVLAFVFAEAAVHKLRDPAAFSGIVRGHALVPDGLAPGVTASLIAGEGLAALALLAPFGAAPGAALALALLSVYSTAIGVNLARGRRDVDCGCLGPGQRQSLAPWMLLRNGILGIAAAACLIPLAARPLSWLDGISIAGGASVLILVFLAATRLAATGASAIGSGRSA